MKIRFAIFIVFGSLLVISQADEQNSYKICVPRSVLKECKQFLENPPSSVASVKCIEARDRMECMEKVKLREADFVFVDPEDMYVAYKMNNQDFSVFSELRTLEEPAAEFRYEGIILIKKNANIHSLNDLKGKKSCHTGFGRNVGYKIPITKLKKSGVFKVSKETNLSPVEKELKALSEFFTKSCIVGEWSPNTEVNQVLKKRYSNLCEMCEDPVKCNYPDKYSGYDGAIRCLVENNGDVAFTKTIFVKKYFGLPIGHGNTATPSPRIGNPDDYEYLCEDGSRTSLTGPPCTWAQRPWQGYMSNADVKNRLKKLQDRMKTFYEDGKTSPDKVGAKKMEIDEKLLVVAKETPVLPGEHLESAKYRDVIERDGSTQQKIKVCVSSEIELKKCDTLKRAAYSRDVRPEIECLQKSKPECIAAVKSSEADVVAVHPIDYKEARRSQLKVILYEVLDASDVYVTVVPKNTDNIKITKGGINFDANNLRSQNAALNLAQARGTKKCPNTLDSDNSSVVKIMHSNNLGNLNAADYELVCKDMSKKSLTNFKDCNFEFTLPTAIFSRPNLSSYESDNINHAFTALSTKFGHGGKNEDVFELFGEFEKGKENVLFDDNAASFVTIENQSLPVDETEYNALRCVSE